MKCLARDRAFRECASHAMSTAGRNRLDPMIRNSILVVAAFLVFWQTSAAQVDGASNEVRTNPTQATQSRTMPLTIIIGFVGGFIKHDNLAHSEVQLAARLRQAYPTGVDVETFESYHEVKARKRVLQLLDTNHDGTLTHGEKENARIIVYGHSWGGSEAVALARDLEKDSVPVLLTIQVDSISKIHQDDAIIPANVAQAANFFQSNGLLHGQPEIRAADPTHTNIVGNFRFYYKKSPYNCVDYPWYDRIFGKQHTQIECDPRVWEQAEALIRAELFAAKPIRPTAKSNP
jgi:hypothetical protein